MTQEAPVLVEIRGTTLWITINRPERRNAINESVIEGIKAGMLQASADPQIRAVVLTGVGEKAFCAGGDLQQGTSVFGDLIDEPTTDFGRLARVVRQMGIPIIGRINGACVAGGTALMSLCDLVVAADHARFGLPETKVGVIPVQVQVYFRNLIHPRHALELILTGDLIDAQRAREIGLVNYVVPNDELDARVDALLEKVKGASPVATKRMKQAINAMETMNFHEAIAFAESQIMLTAQTSDAKEGLASFVEKRKPRWAE
ncbi:enoyl-CoA hydratase-related protein [Aquamicrobium zhengzhouense]|uniref:Enoyl-CoA hydratase/isomerase family protein n=1 Tax=Aquamicrobium zhengzhouense TaxID=2781738 RepID=A0ABS0SGQ1_9HYPH|nr:enoyl-CoA hydratase-related protein [Aquamicrobium zhengzhouense]MBI1622411.1 enoyl-CoA hydratase/isomerase family protein [Aquamicrobium zhengzhouense]